MQYLGSIGMDSFISELCYKGKILQRNYRKMTSSWSFSYNSIVIFHDKNIWEPQRVTVLYQNLCYNEVCYKGTALYLSHITGEYEPKAS